MLTGNFIASIQKEDLLTLPDEQVSIYNDARELIYANIDSINQSIHFPILAKLTENYSYQIRQGRVELVGMQYKHQGKTYYIIASGSDLSGFAKSENLAFILLIGNVSSFALIIIAGWYFASTALKPISRLIEQVDTITAIRLDVRLGEGNKKDEIAKLAITFNRMLDRVQKAFESQKGFISHASHELRTPLTNALGTLETSYTYDQDLNEIKQSMLSSMEEIKKIKSLTNALLTLAKAEGSSFKNDPIYLEECLMDALDSIKTKYPLCKIQLTVDSLESTQQFMVLEGNSQLLHTAIYNLLENACKYSQQQIEVEFGSFSKDQMYLKVIDHGLGIPENEQNLIFNPLYRGSNSKNISGLGIGLAVTQKIISYHKGYLKVSSQLGQGTCITMVLPLREF